MRRALSLAALGSGYVSPNPLVGCVLVANNQIIGEGWHKRYGGPHAEINAVNSVKNTALLAESTAYVTLEPCAHYGKTPPCALLLIEKKIKRVVIACIDPFPEVAGKGIALLKTAGIEVVMGVCEKEARWQNRRFFTAVTQKRPYIILKWAETSNGLLAGCEDYEKQISGLLAQQLVHRYRHEEDGILVGANTILQDDPALTTRLYPGKNPQPIVLDFSRTRLNSSINTSYRLFNGPVSPLYFTNLSTSIEKHIELKADNDNWIKNILNSLLERKIHSILVEGGSKTLQAFIDQGFWDEIRCFQSPKTFTRGIAAPKLPTNCFHLERQIGEDKLQLIYKEMPV